MADETAQDPVADALRKTPTTASQRALVWDAYYQEGSTPESFGAALKGFNLPTPIKAYLWDLKAGTPSAPPWTLRYPKTAAVARAGLDALPGIGMVVGGVLSTPETMGVGTVAGGAVGAGVGRGARDLIGEATGLEPTSSPVAKGARIAGDIALTAATGKVAEGVGTILKEPGWALDQAKRDLLKFIPEKLRPVVTAMGSRQEAARAILTRPGWQSPETLAWAREYAPAEVKAVAEAQMPRQMPPLVEYGGPRQMPPIGPQAPPVPRQMPPLAEQATYRSPGATAAPREMPALYHPTPTVALEWIKSITAPLNEWQQGFITSITAQSEAGRTLTPAQANALRKIVGQ